MPVIETLEGSEPDSGATFDGVPDHLVVHILNLVADVRSLARCRCACRRLAALVPQADRLLLRVDAVVPSQSEDLHLFPFLHRLLASLLHSLSHLLFSASSADKPLIPPPPPPESDPSASPAYLLRGFDRVRELEIELPGGDLRLAEKGAVLRWRASFGRRLRTCVILAARTMTSKVGAAAAAEGGEEHGAAEEGLKERVIWTIGALIAASARHHMVRELVRGRRGEGMESLVVRDRDVEGVLVMYADGLREWREATPEEDDEDISGGERWRRGRTTVPAVRMRMRHAKRLDLGGGVGMERAVLVVATAAGEEREEGEEEEVGVVRELFGEEGEEGVFRCAAEELLNRPSYILEMNSF